MNNNNTTVSGVKQPNLSNDEISKMTEMQKKSREDRWNIPDAYNGIEEMEFDDIITIQNDIDYNKVNQENLEKAFIEQLMNYIATD